MMRNFFWIACTVVIISCSGDKSSQSRGKDTSGVEYATGFAFSNEDGYTKVEILTPYQNANERFTYVLIPRENPIPDLPENSKIIRTPVESIVCTSTSHIPLIDYLNLTDKLIGFPTTDYISSPAMRARIDSGEVVDLGVDKSMNVELLASLNPDLVMSYSVTGDLGQVKKIQELGIPVVLNADFLEQHPLGRAEWIKFMGLLFSKEQQADSIFEIVKHSYLSTMEVAASTDTQPSVLSGIVYGDTWFLPGGQNYAARMLHDAHCNYLWSDDPSNGFLQLSFESVYLKAKDADLWIGVGSYHALNEMMRADTRYAGFEAFKSGEVYTYNARVGARGGSEFLELGYLRPDIILKDLVKIAHPDRLPEYELYFHKKLP